MMALVRRTVGNVSKLDHERKFVELTLLLRFLQGMHGLDESLATMHEHCGKHLSLRMENSFV